MKKALFTGSGVAIVTPFTKDGVDYAKLGELIEFQINNKTDSIIICGTTGEASTMPDGEHMQVVKYAVDKVAGRVPVIAGTGSNDTAHCIELSKEAEKLGADGLLIVTPYYNKTTQKGLILHFEAVANAVKTPIVLYNVPSRTGLNISAQTLKTLSKHPNINAIKESSGNLALTSSIAAACGDDIIIYTGNDDIILPTLAIGGKGCISVIANILPEDTHNIIGKFMAGDIAGSCEIQLKMMELIDALFCEVNPIPIKTAMNLLGYNVGELRMPLCDMADANLQKLKTALSNYGLL